MGGNQTSRYNWEEGNVYNSGSDWFFENATTGKGPDPIWRTLLTANASHHVLTAIEIPMLGWVAKDATSISFPLSRHPSQQSRTQRGARATGGARMAPRSRHLRRPRRASRRRPHSRRDGFEQIKDFAAKVGSPSPRVYVLDNEPALWSSTHRDVHPDPVTYDELWERTRAYATAIRDADPQGLIAGPAAWGWLEYSYSAKDAQAGVYWRPDRRAHEDLPLIAWYLRQAARHEKQTGKKLLDLLDVHFYPQATGVGITTSGSTDARTRALRIRSTRALWDPSYTDESWIGEPVKLLPRLHEWIDAYDPGVNIQIGEWNFGAETDMSGGLAVAEALARFADGGVTAAYYWPYPALGSAAYFAFRAYRDFDGHGGRSWTSSRRASRPRPPRFGRRATRPQAPRARRAQHRPGCRRRRRHRRLVVRVRGFGARVRVSARQMDFAKLDAAPRSDGVSVHFAPYSISVVDVVLH